MVAVIQAETYRFVLLEVADGLEIGAVAQAAEVLLVGGLLLVAGGVLAPRGGLRIAGKVTIAVPIGGISAYDYCQEVQDCDLRRLQHVGLSYLSPTVGFPPSSHFLWFFFLCFLSITITGSHSLFIALSFSPAAIS